MKIKGNMRTSAALNLLFSRILEPLALYRINYDDNGGFAGMVYMNVNSAYEKVMGIRKGDSRKELLRNMV